MLMNISNILVILLTFSAILSYSLLYLEMPWDDAESVNMWCAVKVEGSEVAGSRGSKLAIRTRISDINQFFYIYH